MRTPTPDGTKSETTSMKWCPQCSGDKRMSGSCPHVTIVEIKCPEPGEIIANDYEYISLLGMGGMGVVYKCRNIHLNRIVAIKMLAARRYGPEDAVRFQKEARAAGKFNHPNLVSILDFGITSDAEPFMVMEYLEGETLSSYMEQNAASVNELVSIFEESCLALAYAHEHGVLHRDLKPDNIMIVDLNGNSVIKILDFGIARIADAGRFDKTISEFGVLFGTPAYMSPEQSISGSLTDRSDVYSMGCVMYEAFAGRRPFVGGSALDLARQHQFETPKPIVEVGTNQSIPESLTSLISAMLSKEAEGRPSMKMVADELRKILDKDDLEKSETEEDKLKNKTVEEREPSTRNYSKSIALLCGLVVLGVIGIFVLTHSNQEDKKPSDGPGNFTDPFDRDPARLEYDVSLRRTKDQLDPKTSSEIISYSDIKIIPEHLKMLVAGRSRKCVMFRIVSCDGVTLECLELLRSIHAPAIVIHNSDITNDGLKLLSTFKDLEAIDLAGNLNIDNSGIANLKRAPVLKRMTLQNINFDEQTIKICAEMNLKTLELLDNSKFDDRGLLPLLKSKIEELLIRNVSITDRGLEIISGMPYLVSMVANDLSITDRGVTFLSRAPKLVSIDLAYNQGVSDRSVKTLLEIYSHHPADLITFNFGHTSMTGESASELKKLKNIRALLLRGLVGFTPAIQADLRKALPRPTKLEFVDPLEENRSSDFGL